MERWLSVAFTAFPAKIYPVPGTLPFKIAELSISSSAAEPAVQSPAGFSPNLFKPKYQKFLSVCLPPTLI